MSVQYRERSGDQKVGIVLGSKTGMYFLGATHKLDETISRWIIQFKGDWLHWWKFRIILSSRLHPTIILLIVTAQYYANIVQ